MSVVSVVSAGSTGVSETEPNNAHRCSRYLEKYSTFEREYSQYLGRQYSNTSSTRSTKYPQHSEYTPSWEHLCIISNTWPSLLPAFVHHFTVNTGVCTFHMIYVLSRRLVIYCGVTFQHD